MLFYKSYGLDRPNIVEKFCPRIALMHPLLGPVKLHHSDLGGHLAHRSSLTILQDSAAVERFLLRFRDKIPSAAMVPRNIMVVRHKLQKQKMMMPHSGAEVILGSQGTSIPAQD